jgi:hypothetical protein
MREVSARFHNEKRICFTFLSGIYAWVSDEVIDDQRLTSFFVRGTAYCKRRRNHVTRSRIGVPASVRRVYRVSALSMWRIFARKRVI